MYKLDFMFFVYYFCTEITFLELYLNGIRSNSSSYLIWLMRAWLISWNLPFTSPLFF